MKRFLLLLTLCLASAIVYAQKTTLTTTGTEIIKVGGNISSMPQSVTGVYDKIVSEQLEDMGDTYTNYKFVKDGNVVAQVEDFTNQGEMSTIKFLSPDFEIEGISVGTPVSQVFNSSKAKQVHQRDGEFYFEIDDVIIKVEPFSEAGLKRLQDAYSNGTNVTLTLSDFENDAVVTYLISTGYDSSAVAANQDSANSSSFDPMGDMMKSAPAKSKNKTQELIINIILNLLIVGAIVHMLIKINSEQEERIFVGSRLRMILLGVLGLLPVFFGFGREVGFWTIAFQIVGTALFLVFYYYANLKPVSLFLKTKPSKDPFFYLPGIWNYIDIDTERMYQERKRVYKEQIEKAQDKINKQFLDNEEYQKEMSKISDASVGDFLDTVYLFALKWLVIIIITILYISVTPFVAIYSYLRNYIINK